MAFNLLFNTPYAYGILNAAALTAAIRLNLNSLFDFLVPIVRGVAFNCEGGQFWGFILSADTEGIHDNNSAVNLTFDKKLTFSQNKIAYYLLYVYCTLQPTDNPFWTLQFCDSVFKLFF